MQTITMNMDEAHDFDTYEDAEIVASQWQGAEVQQVTYNGLNPEPRTAWNVMLPVPSRDYPHGLRRAEGVLTGRCDNGSTALVHSIA